MASFKRQTKPRTVERLYAFLWIGTKLFKGRKGRTLVLACESRIPMRRGYGLWV